MASTSSTHRHLEDQHSNYNVNTITGTTAGNGLRLPLAQQQPCCGSNLWMTALGTLSSPFFVDPAPSDTFPQGPSSLKCACVSHSISLEVRTNDLGTKYPCDSPTISWKWSSHIIYLIISSSSTAHVSDRRLSH